VSDETIAAQPQVRAYNARHYRSRRLDNLLAGRRVTLIVVGDLSTDGARERVPAYAQRNARVRCIITSAYCGGPARRRNLGVGRVRNEWGACCDVWRFAAAPVRMVCCISYWLYLRSQIARQP
jgi:Glycosyl transferase family 2